MLPSTPRQRSGIGNAWVTASVFLLSLLLFAQMTNNLIAKVYFPTGDEPYYLLMAHSLIHDGDLELTNNFAAKDYWHYYPGELYPRHESITVRPGLWSKHAPGVAFLIVPGYALLDWLGAAYTVNLLAALLAANIYLLAYEASGRKLVGLFVWAALALTNPVASYAPLVFPAIPAALFTLYAYRQIRGGRLAAGGPRLVAASLCIGALPWLNPQLVPLALGLFVYAVAKLIAGAETGVRAGLLARVAALWSTVRLRACPLALLIAPLVVSGALYEGYYYYLYESFLPNWQDHAGSSTLPQTGVAVLGTFLDQQWGLIIYAPLLLLGFAGLLVMLRGHRRELAWLAVVGLPYFAVIMVYKQWWGEWCPPGRYMTPLIPLLALPMAYAVPALRRWRVLVPYAPLVLASALVMAAFVIKPRLMYNHPVGEASLLLWLVEQGGPDLTRLVPTFFIPDQIERNVALAGVWVLAAGALVVLAWRAAWGATEGDELQ